MTDPVQIAIKALQVASEAERLVWEAADKITPEQLRDALEADGWTKEETCISLGSVIEVYRIGLRDKSLSVDLHLARQPGRTQKANLHAFRMMLEARKEPKMVFYTPSITKEPQK